MGLPLNEEIQFFPKPDPEEEVHLPPAYGSTPKIASHGEWKQKKEVLDSLKIFINKQDIVRVNDGCKKEMQDFWDNVPKNVGDLPRNKLPINVCW